jgi:hypothetical protein
MSDISMNPLRDISKSFVPEPYRQKGEDAYQCANPVEDPGAYRLLQADEIEVLVKNANNAENWNEILVTDDFNPELIINCDFFGRVYIGDLSPKYLEYHDLRLPVGLRDSTIISCVIGRDVAIRDVHYLAHYKIGDGCILFNIDEMLCTDHAKFGNGILKEGEDEEVRIWLEVGNENDGRKILPFEDLICADAYLWSKYRGDAALMKRLVEVTEAGFSKRRGFYGEIGERTVIKDCRILKDVRVGSYAYVKGANKLKNLTILSSREERTQIGEGTELVNGIVGYGSRIFYEAKAIRFVTGRNTQLKYGARLLNSVLGDNSTVSCCELLNNLIFPFHEQHHNNSFLIATTILGQSNIAAGATIGSNHNSRAPDGEILAGRGFWPGLCSNFKHNSRFASFSLVAKGSYSYELNVLYPFSLVFLKNRDDQLHVSPAYWFIHNMYAMARNSWKFRKRDARVKKVQNIEFDYLAPDTIQEILAAMRRLELIAGRAALQGAAKADEALQEAGRARLSDPALPDEPLQDAALMKRYGGMVEKPGRGWRFYRDFSRYFAVKTLVDALIEEGGANLPALAAKAAALGKEPCHQAWVNLGGQIVPKAEVERLKADIVSGTLNTWAEVHARYDELWKAYPRQKQRYALHVLESLYGKAPSSFSKSEWAGIVKEASETFAYICEAAFSSRKKDYEDPFRIMAYDDEAEMIAVLGRYDDNSFLRDLRKQTDEYLKVLGEMLKA